MSKNKYIKPGLSLMKADVCLPITTSGQVEIPRSLEIKNEAEDDIHGDVKVNDWGFWED